ncbi:hypothetical protein LK542_04735 [Massilia sp. IC2-477]|uniref:hypothetical protein n=1 Tax=Massilia sp. IC2-477 TaxID=2887198 RepID=UPI001D10810D|nr:hypothetical protein [Massilia sp. IC2-477]MCC2954921.1 hypothetical protein [Massilia sp. IC2-477]
MNALNRVLVALFYAALLLPLNVSSSKDLASSTGTNTMADEKLFQQVPLDTNEQTPCSPEDPGFNWRGVVIRAPSTIILPKRTAQLATVTIPICGLYLVDVANKFRYPGPKILIFSDDSSGQTYKGALVKRNIEPTIPPPPSQPINPSSKAAFSEYFNVNAAAYLALPIQPARYRVSIEYAGYRSNEVMISVVEHP